MDDASVIIVTGYKGPATNALEFHPDTAICMPPSKTSLSKYIDTSSFTFKIKTSEPNGMILSMAGSSSKETDYSVIAMRDGHVEFAYNLGAQLTKPETIKSTERIDDGKWHTVKINRAEKNGSLTVNTKKQEGQSKDGYDQLNTDGNVCLGKNKKIPEWLPEQYKNGFKGCIGDVMVKQKVFTSAVINEQGLLEFCS
ncbi:AGRN (predicted) [Pycnogonum litorale]